MRIGELAATVGVTTRAVRHYHHLGLLPEPERLGNGYRNYTLRHAVVLARIRRLTELGLGLAEVRDVLADDAGKDLAEVLTELDEDLARQEAAIRERRARLRALLETEGGLTADGPVSPELAALFEELGGLAGSPSAAKDREVLALIESTAPPEERERFMGLVGSALSAPGGLERAQRAYALLDELVDAGTDDPRVDEAVELLATALPEELAPDGAGFVDQEHAFLRALYADFAPAQAEVIRRLLRRLGERAGRKPAGEEGQEGEEREEG
ncbi:MerR family transcriptional regulator [Streptomyces sp. NPDC029526]|uniref:MerR family transcriptional regulator n=1 Tax=Streptomyces sp. NPDC029526 TaxID=3155728 RepID=UPI0033EB20ED